MTTQDPIEELRTQLVAAGHRRTATTSAAPRRVVSRRVLLAAAATLTVAAPATAAITGILPSGSTPDGSTYAVQRIARDGKTCERTEFRDPDGKLNAQVDNCGRDASPASAPAAENLSIDGYTVAPGKTWLIRGTVSSRVARVIIGGTSGPVALTADGTDDRRAFTAVSTDKQPVVHALDQDGREIDTFTIILPQ